MSTGTPDSSGVTAPTAEQASGPPVEKRRLEARVVIKGGTTPPLAPAHASAHVPAPASVPMPVTARPWIRGPFRRHSAKPMTHGFAGSIGLHLVIAILAMTVGLGTSGMLPKPFDPDRATSVEVQLPRLEAPAAEIASIAAEPPAPAGPAMMPPRVAPPPRAPDVAPRPAPPAPKAVEAPPPPPRPSGDAGRARAQNEVVKQLGDVNGSLDRVLSDLSASLASTDARSKVRGAASPADTLSRARTVGRARTADQIASVGASNGNGRGGVGLAGGTGPISATGVAIAALLDRTVLSGGGGGGGAGGEAGGRGAAGARGAGGAGDLRSNASLLATVRRYAPGIQFCYDNELKRSPGLRGKLVVSMTVAASGEVTEAGIVQDAVGSPSLAACTLAQVRGWRFPAIPAGEVAFKTPFVFTPPE